MNTQLHTSTPRSTPRQQDARVSPVDANATIRNIGIAAHVDAGKTTLSERILYYAGRIRTMGDVRGKGRPAALMDTMAIEQRRGITIQSAATHLRWGDAHINLIDTPGHVDFTVEVERALAVLDGAVLVLCAVAGVQPQTRTVDRQMRRHRVPRLVFINKMDRPGADPAAVTAQLRERLGLRALVLTLPIGRERDFVGVVDVLARAALYFDGRHGEDVRVAPCPDDLVASMEQHREALVEAIAELDDQVLEAYLEDPDVPLPLLVAGLRRATIGLRAVPVLCGSAYHNRGVQPLLDAVVRYLPGPRDVTVTARRLDPGLDDDGTELALRADPDAPLCALAFKLEDGRFGQLTHVRVYQGTLARGRAILNVRTGQRVRVGRLVRMHADAMEDIEAATAGDIAALFGVDCHGGDCFGDGRARYQLDALHVPAPVLRQAIAPEDKAMLTTFARALARFKKEDPSLRVLRDPETGDTLIAGMGELHLDVYRERLRDEYGVATVVSPPQVAYREAPTRAREFNYLHKKQGGGPGQYARVIGELGPSSAPWDPEGESFEFVDHIRQGAIPRDYIPGCVQGIRDALERGPTIGAPVVGLKVTLVDGQSHSKDSSVLAFRIAARRAVRRTLAEAAVAVLEPIMALEVRTPQAHAGPVQTSVVQRRGAIVSFACERDVVTLTARVPLAELFGSADALRGLTQGQADYSMEPAGYEAVPPAVQARLVQEASAREREEPA